MTDVCIFRRIEKKYILTGAQHRRLLAAIAGRLTPDEYGRSTICSMYLDTPDFRLIRGSIDAGAYKEKLRVRSYGTPMRSDKVFFELKKKYDGVVYKRRASMTLDEAEAFIFDGVKPFESQIINELDYALGFYGRPKNAMLICYERDAFYDRTDPTLRITFDSNVRYRCEKGLDMTDGDHGRTILPKDTYLMEIKTAGAMPLWLSRALDECGIFSSSFSKYGTAYARLRDSGFRETGVGMGAVKGSMRLRKAG